MFDVHQFIFPIKLAIFLASGAVYMKLQGLTNDELWMSLSEV